MTYSLYKKMAGTSAVFLSASYDKASPVERDGLVWTSAELHLDDVARHRTQKAAMASVLALEGLEDYDPPGDGDIRRVDAMNETFIYCKKIRGWVQFKIDIPA